MSLRERTRPGLGIIEPCLPSPAKPRLPGRDGCTKSNMTASGFCMVESVAYLGGDNETGMDCSYCYYHDDIQRGCPRFRW